MGYILIVLELSYRQLPLLDLCTTLLEDPLAFDTQLLGREGDDCVKCIIVGDRNEHETLDVPVSVGCDCDTKRRHYRRLYSR